jgi:cell wall-associated NlpC family hydrolase
MMSRIDLINGLIGKPYALGAQGPDAFDCYSAARALQKALFGRDMPAFAMPGEAGRIAIAAAIAVHPERQRWREIAAPMDGCLVTMARHLQGYHLGTWLAEDGGMIVHAIETCGVVCDTIATLEAVGWRRFRFHLPA